MNIFEATEIIKQYPAETKEYVLSCYFNSEDIEFTCDIENDGFVRVNFHDYIYLSDEELIDAAEWIKRSNGD